MTSEVETARDIAKMQVMIDTLKQDVNAMHDKNRDNEKRLDLLEAQLTKYKWILYTLGAVFAFLAKGYQTLFGELNVSLADIFIRK